jgi:hypothetical protein
LAWQMACDVMRRLMAQHKGQFIAVAGIADQGDAKGQNGPPRPVHSLKRIGGLAGSACIWRQEWMPMTWLIAIQRRLLVM